MSINERGYGDVDQIKADLLALREIQSRQGLNFMVDGFAENIAETVRKFPLSSEERERLAQYVISDLTNAISERI
jgi:hypothetical protein